MELKVWVEGIQRVICGVNGSTSCQDVVIALAQATGKTGRFTLIEKWRDNERLLSPSDNPLKILHKWGEYASEVQFILRQSDKYHAKEKLKQEPGKQQRLDKFSHNFTPPPPPQGGGTGIKKSLTFSGAHNYHFPQKPSAKVKPQTAVNSLQSIGEQASPLQRTDFSSSFDSKKPYLTSSPYGSLEKKLPGGYSHHQQNAVNHSGSSSPSGSVDRIGRGADSPRSSQTNSPYDSLERKAHMPYRESPLLDRQKNIVIPNKVVENNIDKIPHVNGKGLANHHADAEELDLDQSLAEEAAIIKLNEDFENDNSYHEKAPSDRKNETEDFIELINLQHERLVAQDGQLKECDAEIQLWERREREHQQESSAVHDEIKKLDYALQHYEYEIREVDSVRWNDELQVLQQNEKTLQSELTLIRSKVSNCEAEILQTKNKIRLLMDDIDEEKLKQNKLQQDQKEEELRILAEVSDLQQQVKDKLKEYESTRSTEEELEKDLKGLEETLESKQKDTDNLEKDIKEANLEIFMKVPSELKPVEIADALSGGRSSPMTATGSSRKLTSIPQKLADIAPSARNPQGLWV